MSTDINFTKRLGVPNGTNILIGLTNPLINAFKARVAADGGTFEASACLEAQLTFLDSIPAIVSSFQVRVAADSGVFEAPTCLESQITFLNSIP
jgi:hypothetical protein